MHKSYQKDLKYKVMSIFEKKAIYPGAELFLIKTFMQTEGFRPLQWLLGTGLSDIALKRPDTLVSLHQFDIIYRNVFRLAQSPDIGLRFGKALNLSRWGMLSLALTSARNLGAALQTANQHRPLVRSRFNLEPEVVGDKVKISVTQRTTMPFPVSTEFGYEMLISSLQRQISDLLIKPFSFSRIQLHYPAPPHFRHYQNHCGCEVEFNSPISTLWIPLSTMLQALPLANQIAEKQAMAICELEMRRVDQIQEGDICGLVKSELMRDNTLPPSLDTLADRLAMSPRTFRRRLHAAGTSYREIYQQHQLQLALQDLTNEQPALEVIAKKCGFQDTASFRQAFKRWTQMTPSEYRAQFRKTSFDLQS